MQDHCGTFQKEEWRGLARTLSKINRNALLCLSYFSLCYHRIVDKRNLG